MANLNDSGNSSDYFCFLADIAMLKSIISESNLSHTEVVNLADYDKRTPLHLAASEGTTNKNYCLSNINTLKKDTWRLWNFY